MKYEKTEKWDGAKVYDDKISKNSKNSKNGIVRFTEGSKKEKAVGIIFLLYLLLLLKVIIFKYPYDQLLAITESWSKSVIWEGMSTANFTLFKTVKMYIQYADRLNSFENLVGNVAVFIPFGFLFPFVVRRGRKYWVMLLHTFVLVLGIEIFQLFSAFGAFDVDDIMLNCVGAMIGWGLFRSFPTENFLENS